MKKLLALVLLTVSCGAVDQINGKKEGASDGSSCDEECEAILDLEDQVSDLREVFYALDEIEKGNNFRNLSDETREAFFKYGKKELGEEVACYPEGDPDDDGSKCPENEVWKIEVSLPTADGAPDSESLCPSLVAFDFEIGTFPRNSDQIIGIEKYCEKEGYENLLFDEDYLESLFDWAHNQ